MRWLVFAVGLLWVMTLGCDEEPCTRPDGSAPAPVTDLRAASVTDTSATLLWTAPGDDCQSGTAAGYDLRQFYAPITASNWDSALRVMDVSGPSSAGETDSARLEGLSPDSEYYFRLLSIDEASNQAPLSNLLVLQTLGTGEEDRIPPSAVSDLSAISATSTSVILAWTAVGDDHSDMQASGYDIRYALTPLDDSTWDLAFHVENEPAPAAAGCAEILEVRGLHPSATYYFAMKVSDDVANWSEISNTAGATTTPSAGCVDYALHVHSSSAVRLKGHEPKAVIAGGYAYVVTRSNRFHILDVSDPTAAVYAGGGDLGSMAQYRDIVVSGHNAYLARQYSNGMDIVDISHPAEPVLVGSIDCGNGVLPVAVGIQEPVAYLCTQAGELWSIDIGDPRRPELLGRLDTGRSTTGMAVSDENAYVCLCGGTLRIVDVSNPQAPRLISIFEVDGGPGLELADGRAYLCDDEDIVLVDLSDLIAPALAGRVATTHRLRDVAVDVIYAYAVGEGGMHGADVSLPDRPVVIGSLSTPSSGGSIQVAEGYAYVASWDPGNEGLRILDVSPLSFPGHLGVVETPGSGEAVAVAGSFAYVADGEQGLQIVDVGGIPAALGSVDLAGSVVDVQVVGTKAYVANEPEGLQVIDVSDPASPELVGSVDLPSYVMSLCMAGDRAFVVTSGALCVVDVANGSAPAVLATLDLNGYGVDLALLGTNLYLTTLDIWGGVAAGLHVIDVSDSVQPTMIAFLEIPEHGAGALTISGTSIYAVGGEGVVVIDIAAPQAPTRLGDMETYLDQQSAIAVRGGHLYIAAAESGLQVIDALDPANPSLIGSISTPNARGVEVVGNRIYVSDPRAGLVVLAAQCP